MIATAFAVAFVVYSCKSGLSEAGKLDLSATPLQIVDSMNMVQTNKGKIEMRVVTGQMQRFDNDSV